MMRLSEIEKVIFILTWMVVERTESDTIQYKNSKGSKLNQIILEYLATKW
jgi:hypothetical protein